MAVAKGVYVGTSGYSYKGWYARFYPQDLAQKDLLGFYADRFNAVEINNSFYMLPKPKTVGHWADETPKPFRFCMKVSRFITHNKKLLEPEDNVPRFLKAIGNIKGRQGALLLQLPPNFKPQLERLDKTLAAFKKHGTGGRWPIAVEVRDERWYGNELNDVLDRNSAGLVLHDMPGSATSDLNAGAPFAYARFHGPQGDYGGEYGAAGLEKMARLLKAHHKAGKEIYAFFNNDRDGYAIEDAQALRKSLGVTDSSSPASTRLPGAR